MNNLRCKEEDRERLIELFNIAYKKIGHDPIKEMYHLNRQIRKELNIGVFPIALFYRTSLFTKLNEEYAQKTTVEIAHIEGLDERRMYYIRKQYWKLKSQNKKLINIC